MLKIFISVTLVSIITTSCQDETPTDLTSKQTQEKIDTFYLPDKTIVQTNYFTGISFSNNPKDRFLKIEGETFINVSNDPGKTFEFELPRFGTFQCENNTTANIMNYPNDSLYQITVLSGKITRKGIGNKITIKAHEIFTAGDGMKEELINTNEETSIPKDYNSVLWLTGCPTFDRAPFKVFFHSLERYYGIKINTDQKIGQRFYRTSYCKATTKPEDLFYALYLVEMFRYYKAAIRRYVIVPL